MTELARTLSDNGENVEADILRYVPPVMAAIQWWIQDFRWGHHYIPPHPSLTLPSPHRTVKPLEKLWR